VTTVNTRTPSSVTGSDNAICTGKLEKVPSAQLGSQLLMLCNAVAMALVTVQLVQWILPRLSALVAQPMKIVLGSNPDPLSWGSQFGAAGRAEGGVEAVMVGGVAIKGGLADDGVVVDAEVLDGWGAFCGLPPHPARNASVTRQQIPTVDLTSPLWLGWVSAAAKQLKTTKEMPRPAIRLVSIGHVALAGAPT
jgi:hypothetical protein